MVDPLAGGYSRPEPADFEWLLIGLIGSKFCSLHMDGVIIVEVRAGGNRVGASNIVGLPWVCL